MSENTIHTSECIIIIQSCADDWANIGIDSGTGVTYRHVDLPSLTRRDATSPYSTRTRQEMELTEFDKILSENKQAVLLAIARLK